MSTWQQQNLQQRFRESLTYEEKIGSQISKCLDSLNENNVDYMHSSIDALLIMTPIRLYDSQFTGELAEMNDEWEAEKQVSRKNYAKELARASGGCPDLVDRPSMQPPREYWEKKLIALINLFDRRGIGLKLEKTDQM